MSLRPSGLWCDMCNSPMLTEVLLGTPVKPFKLSCSPNTLHVHEKCEKYFDDIEAQRFEALPNGPVRELMEKVIAHNAKLDAQAASSVPVGKEEE